MMNQDTPNRKKEYRRFNVSDRIEHILLLVSFTILVITGIPQKYAPAPWAETMIQLMGGIETVRIIHRISAIVLAIESVYHLFTVSYKMFVRHTRLTMLPGPKDVVNFIEAVKFNLGLSKTHPQYGRYNFEEKLEYWAVVWGTAIMGLTGFMLWNPIVTTKLLPGSSIPAAKAAHSGEALLAMLAIIVWHLYGVHIRTFNRSMFTGSLTHEQMLHEHPGELRRIETGQMPPEPSPEAIKRRQRVFIPIAAFIAIVLVVVLYFFVTYEETALTTVPPPPQSVEVFMRATPTPEPEVDPELVWIEYGKNAGAVTHSINEGRENCLLCHALGAIYPYSVFHTERKLSNQTCLICHYLPEVTSPPPTVQRPETPSFANDILPLLEANCTECHGPDDSLDLTNYESISAGGKSGPLVDPVDAEKSLLCLARLIPLAEHPTQPDIEELNLLCSWIKDGAPDN